MDKDKDAAVSCPRGSFSVHRQDSLISICLIDILGISNAIQIIEAINTILEKDRTHTWDYLLFVSGKTAATPEAEKKFAEFVGFRKWISTLTKKDCRLAVLKDQVSPVTLDQIDRTLTVAGVDYKTFSSMKEATAWLEIN